MSTSSSGSESPRDKARNVEPPPGGLAELITESEALRDILHGAYTRVSRLLAALKARKREAKAVEQAVSTLKQLQLDR
jgi:hypothetical protein